MKVTSMVHVQKREGEDLLVIIFSLLKRDGEVDTIVVSNIKASTLMPVITRKVTPGSITS